MFVKKGQNFRARLEGTYRHRRQTIYKILDKKFCATPSASYYFGDLIRSRYDDMFPYRFGPFSVWYIISGKFLR